MPKIGSTIYDHPLTVSESKTSDPPKYAREYANSLSTYRLTEGNTPLTTAQRNKIAELNDIFVNPDEQFSGYGWPGDKEDFF